MAEYAIDIRSLDGRTRLAYLDSVGIMELEYVLTENSPHAARLVIPPGFLNPEALQEDTRMLDEAALQARLFDLFGAEVRTIENACCCRPR